MYANALPSFLQFLIKSMERTEQATCDISKSFLLEKDIEFCKEHKFDLERDVQAKCELLDFKAAQDLYRDAKTFKQVLVEGVSGMKPTTDSSVEFFMKFLINEQVYYSNFKLKGLILEKMWEFVHINEEQDEVITETTPFKAVLNDFTLPPVIHRTLKTMNMNGITKIEAYSVEKLIPYLTNERFKEDYVKEGDKVKIFILLKDFDTVRCKFNLCSQKSLLRFL